MKYKRTAAALVLALALAIGFSYFHVGGKEIASIAAMDEDCEVEVVRHDSLARQRFREYTLAGPQVKELKEFLEGGSYTRRLTFLDKVSYTPVSYSIYYTLTRGKGFCISDVGERTISLFPAALRRRITMN